MELDTVRYPFGDTSLDEFTVKETHNNQIEEDTIYNSTIQLFSGLFGDLPISKSSPLFLVGPNGAGKSSLAQILYRQNSDNAVRISAHRQNWMESNAVSLTPKDKINTEKNKKNQDSQSAARYKEWNAPARSSLIIADLINADNELSREIRLAVSEGDMHRAAKIASSPPPLDVISDIFLTSGIPIKLSIEANSAIVAAKRSSTPYSIAELSDGERSGLLIAGQILTAPKNSLIIIDEPERHLHSSIVVPILSQLINKRPDCAFVISTHELNLPVAFPKSRIVIVRDSISSSNEIDKWDIDILEPGIDVDDLTKEAIIGSRRIILFVEGNPDSIDKPLYELIFPGISIIAKESCGAVERSVRSIRESSNLAWVQPFGIIDQDQINEDKRTIFEEQGIFPLSSYSVESLYYDIEIIRLIANRQCDILGGNPESYTSAASISIINDVSVNKERLAARMTEQVIKDIISAQMPDWKMIKSNRIFEININMDGFYQKELDLISEMINNSDIHSLMKRYPIRETGALNSISSALQFKSRSNYESAVRKLISEDSETRKYLLSNFGKLVSKLSASII